MRIIAKQTKLLSLFLAGVLLFQTAGIDALAAAPDDPLSVVETAEEPETETEIPGEAEKEPVESEKPAESVSENTPETEPETPGEGSENTPETGTETPGENGESTPETETETPGEDGERTPETEEDPEEPAESEAPADSVSENALSEDTVSENTLPEEPEEEDAFSLFPGLGDGYTLSAKQMADKRDLSAHVSDIIDQASLNAKRFPDAEGLYELGEVVYLADTEAEAQQIARAFGGTLDSYAYGVAVIGLPEKATVTMAVAAAADSEINLPAVWPNYYAYADSDPYDPANGDPDYNKQWQHDYIGARYAWAAGYRGQGVKVAVIDSGIDESHEDIYAEPGRNFSSKNASGGAYHIDHGYHGTHVAGIIGAIAGNGHGGAGIAPEATLRSYCVMTKESNGQSGDAANIMRAVNAAVADGNDIINMSLGSEQYTGQYATIIANAYAKGVAVFAAAGNNDSDACHFPAAYPGVISVAAVDQNGARGSFSNFGSTVDLAFPGVSIYSTVPEDYGSYRSVSGTSQATPAAAGTAAVILSSPKGAEIRKKTGKARVDALLSAMKSSTTKSSASGMGAGTTWLPGALKIASDATAPDAPVIAIAETPSPKDRSQKTYIAEAVTVTLTTSTAAGYVDLWYSTDGKTPSYKNGAVTNAVLYEGPFSLGGARSKTLKAIAVNTRTGMVSKAATKTVTLTPIPVGVTVTAAGSVSRIAAGKSLKCTAAVEPAYAISAKAAWSVVDAEGKDASAKGVTAAGGTVKTKTATPAGLYTVTATAVGSDGTSYNGVSGSYTLEVIAKAEIKKVAFQNGNGKAYSKQTLDQGKTLDLKPYLKVTKLDNSAGAAGDVAWSSSNPKIAAVANTADGAGVVTAIAPGKAVIKATSNDGGGKSASFTVTVNQPVTGITLSGASKLAAGKGITLKATVAPANATNKKLTWSVSGNSLVTVSAAGKVSAKAGATGSCTVTATAKDGSGVSSIAYPITVISGAITNIALSDKTLTLFSPQAAVGNAKAAPTEKLLTATVTGTAGYVPDLVAWTSSAPGVASVQNGVVTAHTAGKAIITCAATDGSGKKASCTVNVSLPMSKLMIGVSGRNTSSNSSNLALGKSLKMSAFYQSYYGKPTSTKIIWEVVPILGAKNDVVTIDKNGKIKTTKTAAVGDSAVIRATAADGSGVASNYFYITVSQLYQKITLTYDRRSGGWVPIAHAADGTADYLGISNNNDFTTSVSGGKNAGCRKTTYRSGTQVYYYLQPIPGAACTKKTMRVKVTLTDGSGMSATAKIKVTRTADGTIRYYTT